MLKTCDRAPHGHSVDEVDILVGRSGEEWSCEVDGEPTAALTHGLG